MSDRQAFLTRVRQAAQQGRAYRVHTHETPARVGYVGAAAGLCETLAAEVTGVGGVSHLVADWRGARETVRGLLSESQAKSALCWQHPVLEKLGLSELLLELGIAPLDHREMERLTPAEQRSRQLAADVGLTSADWAIAETGSLLMCSRPGQERVASLLPPLHIAIVERAQILPDLLDAFEKMREFGFDAIPSNMVFITGPSKTGDIELQLTTGVHGPGKWHVVIVTS